jgi:hypothetical protein
MHSHTDRGNSRNEPGFMVNGEMRRSGISQELELIEFSD